MSERQAFAHNPKFYEAGANRLNAEFEVNVANREERRRNAEREAYMATPAGRAQAAAEAAQAERDEYIRTIMGLPEAQTRPNTAHKIVRAYTAASMPVDRARTFLAGLPEEPRAEPVSTAAAGMSERVEAALKRKVELRLSALSMRADNGDQTARREANALAYALRLHGDGNALADALAMSGANVSTFTN